MREALATFSPAERRVAELILSRPHAAMSWSITEMSKFAEASDPSVIRLCRRMGCNGFPALKLELARALARVQQEPRASRPASSDLVAQMMADVLQRSEEALRDAHDDMQPGAVAAAAEAIAKARRIEIYGLGASGFLAQEAQYRLAALGLPAVAYCDPVMQNITAPLLGREDIVVALSFSGLTQYLVESMMLAKQSGARVVSISPAGSPVATLADTNIALNAYRKSENFLVSPTARLALHMILDILSKAVVERLPKR
ncbi:hypothetical protein NN6n1_32760 [Shinella zoogloeoides]